MSSLQTKQVAHSYAETSSNQGGGGGGGDVQGPSAGVSTDNAAARWDGTSGRLLQNSLVIISDLGDVNARSVTIAATAGAAGSLIMQDNAGGEGVTFTASGTTTSYSVIWPPAVGSTGDTLRATVAGTVATLAWGV